jgi:hypothetical protein
MYGRKQFKHGACLRRAVKEVLQAQRLIKDPGDRYEVILVLQLAETVAGSLGEVVVTRDLSAFAQAIREGLFD